MKSWIAQLALGLAVALSGLANAAEDPSQAAAPQATPAAQVGMVDAPCPPRPDPAANRDMVLPFITPGHPFADYLKSLSREKLMGLMQLQKDLEAEKVR